MSIYTRGGDDGWTSLANGQRVSKSDRRVEAYGAVDEANSAVGLARVVVSDTYLEDVLRFIQHRLFNCSSALSVPPSHQTEHTPAITAQDVAELEAAADKLEARVGPLKEFVIESGCEAAARLHLARTIVRRAERCAVALTQEEPVDEFVLAFLNRCSDVLFSGARCANALAGSGDEIWDASAPRPWSPE